MANTGISSANQRQMHAHKPMYEAYRNSERREVNKAKKLVKHLKSHPTSDDAYNALANFSFTVRRKAKVSEFFEQITKVRKEMPK